MSVRQRRRIGASIAARRQLEAILLLSKEGQLSADCQTQATLAVTPLPLLKSLTDEEESEFVFAIDNKRAAAFGLVKLSALELNKPIQVAGKASGLTLISYSSSLERDPITTALLRAGCDPSIFVDAQKPDLSLLKHLWTSIPAPYAVWLVNLHCAAVRTSAAINSTSDTECRKCRQRSGEAFNPVIKVPSCDCHTCSRCFWNACRRASSVREATCPCCQLVLDPVDAAKLRDQNAIAPNFPWDPASPSPSSPSAAPTIEAAAGELQRLLADGESLKHVGQWSRAHWLRLPADSKKSQQLGEGEGEGGSEGECDKEGAESPVALPPSATKRLFVALSLRALHARSLGRTRAQRTAQLILAASQGNVLRVLYLVAVGVSVAERNEYGQSALFLSRWKGHAKVARVLESLGAEDMPDWTGVRPSDFKLAMSVAAMEEEVKLGAGMPWGCRSDPPLATVLMPHSAQHAGAGSFFLDGSFTDEFLDYLSDLPDAKLPLSPAEKVCCSDRYYWSDSTGILTRAVAWALARAKEACPELFPIGCSGILPNMRYLAYRHAGGVLPPHIDLCRSETTYSTLTDADDDADAELSHTITSTHTFLLYLTTCDSGGETALLRCLPRPPPSPMPLSEKKRRKLELEMERERERMGPQNVIASVTPTRGRLLCFPHACPHEGRLVECVPKVCVRGEMY